MPVVSLESPRRDDVLPLLHQADDFALALYPAENYHRLDIDDLERADVGFYVAREDGEALGTVAIVDRGDGSAELKRMFVTASARGLGVGQALINTVEEHARNHGVTVIRLETGVPQTAAIALYEKSGYRPIPAFGPYIGDPTSYCMEKSL
ncbi:putative acetyltransferase [Agreia bicolorata]|uniref:Putative acetyltransferase n=1 Tax=Agreia bicolorata TaxID=110935 RepID=A0A1T4XMH9_9MICO|nr:GNAT family N-acetyltransferase [Agreia bicolorata]SKA90739.1 putative acetyltransferase [Agreia bicolorata]